MSRAVDTIRYTPHAEKAFREAERLAGTERIERRHLIWAIASLEDSAAVAVLHKLGASPEAIRAACMALDVDAGTDQYGQHPIWIWLPDVSRRAWDSARDMGDLEVGTAHLLLALISDVDAAKTLRNQGVTPERIRGELLRLSWSSWSIRRNWTAAEEMPGARLRTAAFRPRVLAWLAAWVGLQFLGGMLFLILAGVAFPILAVETIWRNGLCLAWYGQLWARERRAWAVFMSVLFVQAASGAALVALTVVQSRNGFSWHAMTPTVVWYGVLAWLTIAWFRARWWFGVGEREGWRVLMQDAGWAVGISALLSAIMLAWLTKTM